MSTKWISERALVDPLQHLRIYVHSQEVGAVLSCKCSALLTATVALLPRGRRVEVTGIGCLKCGTMTPVRRGVIENAKEALQCP
jgi:hypothetical protein